jgi:hypothetical protein
MVEAFGFFGHCYGGDGDGPNMCEIEIPFVITAATKSFITEAPRS